MLPKWLAAAAMRVREHAGRRWTPNAPSTLQGLYDELACPVLAAAHGDGALAYRISAGIARVEREIDKRTPYSGPASVNRALLAIGHSQLRTLDHGSGDDTVPLPLVMIAAVCHSAISRGLIEPTTRRDVRPSGVAVHTSVE